MPVSTDLWSLHNTDFYLNRENFPEPEKKKLKQTEAAGLKYTNLWPNKKSCTSVSLKNFIKKNHPGSPYGETPVDSIDRLYTKDRIRTEPIQPDKTQKRQQHTSFAPNLPPEGSKEFLKTLAEINTSPDSYTNPLIEQSTPELNTEAASSSEFNSDYPDEELFEYQPPVSGSCVNSETVSCNSFPSPALFTNYLKSSDMEKERFPEKSQTSEQLPLPQELLFTSQNHKPLTTTPLGNQKNISLNTPSNITKKESHDTIKSILININSTCMNFLYLKTRNTSSNTTLLMAIKYLESIEKKPDTTETPAEKATTSTNQPRSNKKHSSLQVNRKIDYKGKHYQDYINKINILKEQLNLPETATILETLKNTAEALIKNQQELHNKPLYFSDILDL